MLLFEGQTQMCCYSLSEGWDRLMELVIQDVEVPGGY